RREGWSHRSPNHRKQSKEARQMRRQMRRPRDLDARPTCGLAEENIARSAMPESVERERLPLLVNPNIDSGTGRAHGQFATLFSEIALATSTAAISAFVVLWTFTTAWTPSPNSRSADEDSGPTQAAVEGGATKEQPISRARLAILRAPSGSVDDAIPLGVSLAGANGSASLLISGLPAGSPISTGRPLEAGNWRL